MLTTPDCTDRASTTARASSLYTGNFKLVGAEQNAEAAADHRLALPIGVVGEPDSRADIHPPVRLVRVIRIAPRTEVELVVAQTVEVDQFRRIVLIERLDGRVRV